VSASARFGSYRGCNLAVGPVSVHTDERLSRLSLVRASTGVRATGERLLR
jgi:hypothetical protein